MTDTLTDAKPLCAARPPVQLSKIHFGASDPCRNDANFVDLVLISWRCVGSEPISSVDTRLCTAARA